MKRIYKIYILVLLLSTVSSFAQNNIDITEYLNGIRVEDICDDGENIWIATNGNGVYEYMSSTGKLVNYSTSNNKLRNDFIYSIAAGDQYVWAGSIDGLFMLDKKSMRWGKRKFGLGGQLSNWIRALAYDEYSNALWIGRFQYLTKYDIKRRRFYDYDLTRNKNEKTNTIKAIAVDGDSLVWFGTEAGLHKYDKSRDVDDQDALIFYDNRLNYFNGDGDVVSVSSMLFDQDMIWIGLDEFITVDRPEYNIGGLYKFDRRNEWFRFDTNNGLEGNGIYSIEITGNYIWAAQYQFGKNSKDTFGRGLVLINRSTMKAYPIKNDLIPDDILSMHFDGSNLWLGHKTGLIKIKLTNELANWNF
jgi:ligand-binding sensor domain-containing protein